MPFVCRNGTIEPPAKTCEPSDLCARGPPSGHRGDLSSLAVERARRHRRHALRVEREAEESRDLRAVRFGIGHQLVVADVDHVDVWLLRQPGLDTAEMVGEEL